MFFVTKHELLRTPGGFSPLVNWALASTQLSHAAKCCYAAIAGLIFDSRSHKLAASENDLANRYNSTARSFRRHLQELVDVRLLTVEHRSGRSSFYHLCNPLAAELGSSKHVFAKVDEIEEHEEELVHYAEYVEEPKTQQIQPRSKMTAVQRVLPYKEIESPKGDSDNKQCTVEQPAIKPRRHSEFDRPAIGFLQQHFDTGASRFLYSRYSAEKILHARSVYERRKRAPNNPAGFIRYVIRKKYDPQVVTSNANEVLHLDLKREFALERSRESAARHRAEKEKSLSQWLEEQPDRDQLIERAKRHVLLACGEHSDRKTVGMAVRGFLWRQRASRGRETAGVLTL